VQPTVNLPAGLCTYRKSGYLLSAATTWGLDDRRSGRHLVGGDLCRAAILGHAGDPSHAVGAASSPRPGVKAPVTTGIAAVLSVVLYLVAEADLISFRPS
jgi:hypothetical protein